jgi:hypothetical protein
MWTIVEPTLASPTFCMELYSFPGPKEANIHTTPTNIRRRDHEHGRCKTSMGIDEQLMENG